MGSLLVPGEILDHVESFAALATPVFA
jgi:hypothetical protein